MLLYNIFFYFVGTIYIYTYRLYQANQNVMNKFNNEFM